MNRVTAVLLAAGALLVHMLALYRDASGAFGVPYESAYAAFRLGRNLAHEGVLAWDTLTGDGGLASYPSPLWVASAWLAERLWWWSVTQFAQLIGILSTLGTVAISTRFDTDRIAGIVPALLLVSCGALAIAGPSGTEWSLVTLLFVTAFVAQEHGRRAVLAVSLAALVAARPEGVLMVGALAVQCLTARRPRLLSSYVPAALTLPLLALAGAGYGHQLREMLTPDSARVMLGLGSLWDFVRTTVSPFLIVFPLIALAVGELSAVGRRAAALSLAWTTIIVMEGGGPWALQLAFVPALPLVFIAVEQGIASALDTYKPAMERLAWLAIGVAMAGSLLASRFPGDLGPIRLMALYERWLTPAARPPQGHPPVIARASLHQEIILTREARRIGRFARENLSPETTLLTPWPGAIGYISRIRVLDLLGRTTALPGAPLAPWWPTWRTADLVAALSLEPDYILPSLSPHGLGGGAPTVVAREFISPADLADPEFERAVRGMLAHYELVACPAREDPNDRRPIYFMRRVDSAAWPVVKLTRSGAALVVEVVPQTVGPPLLVHLEVLVACLDGRRVWMAPSGTEWASTPRAARGTFEVRADTPGHLALGRYELPPDALRVSAQLFLPTVPDVRSYPFAGRAEMSW